MADYYYSVVHVLLSKFYLDFIWILETNLDKIWIKLKKITLSKFYPNFIQILSRFFRISLYSNFILILSG